MVVTDAEIDRMARDMIARYGGHAAQQAAERLNRMIDRSNFRGRDVWACVVHAIHRLQGSGPAHPVAVPDWHADAERLNCGAASHPEICLL